MAWQKVAAVWLRDDGHIARMQNLELSINVEEDIKKGEKLSIFLNTPYDGKELHPKAPSYVVKRKVEDGQTEAPPPPVKDTGGDMDDVPF